MMSSIPWRTSVPGAMRAIEARRRGSRRGSSSDGVRVKPRGLSVLSGVIQPRLDRVAQRLRCLYVEFATSGGAGRSDDSAEAQLRALLEPAGGLRGRADAAGDPDLAQGPHPPLPR